MVQIVQIAISMDVWIQIEKRLSSGSNRSNLNYPPAMHRYENDLQLSIAMRS